MNKIAVTSPELAPPVGPFFQASEVDRFLFFSGEDPRFLCYESTALASCGGSLPFTTAVNRNGSLTSPNPLGERRDLTYSRISDYSQRIVDTGAVQQVRRFNRIVAERIGALDDRFLKRDRPIGEARLLWEIGSHGAEVRELRSRLGIDSGYLSRVLRSLEKQRLIRTRVVPEDRRLRRIFLTRTGLAERAELERRSDELATTILESLSDQQRSVLTAAMSQVEQLLRASMITFGIEPPTTPDARWCFDQYTVELNGRFDGGFDPRLSISADPQELTPPMGLLILGRLQGRPVGCGALKFHKQKPAELKRMWIAESVRGLGVGRRLLAELERHARKAGVKVLRLETNRALHEAIHLYRRSGYVEVEAFNAEPYAHHWFEKQLVVGDLNRKQNVKGKLR